MEAFRQAVRTHMTAEIWDLQAPSIEHHTRQCFGGDIDAKVRKRLAKEKLTEAGNRS